MARKLEMYVARKRCEVSNVFDVLHSVEEGLIVLRDAPAQGHVEGKQLRKLLRGFAGVGVAPSPERHKLFAVFIEGKITVHHGRYAYGVEIFNRLTIIFDKLTVTFADAALGVFEGV